MHTESGIVTDNDKEQIDIEKLEKQLQKRIQNILQSLGSLSIIEAKAFLQTIIEKVTVINEGELDIEFHRI